MFYKVLLSIFVVAITNSQALPIWINGFGYPAFIHRTPSIAMGFGSGYSSNINGIRHSSGIGAAFSNGGQAFGMGVGGDATGIGFASADPEPIYNSNGLMNGGAVPYIYQNLPTGYRTPFAPAHDGFKYEVAMSENSPSHQLAMASNAGSSGVSSANTISSGNFQRASALTSSTGGNGYSSSISSAQNLGESRSSLAHTTQLNRGSLQHSGASAFDNFGVQTADAHAVRLGY